MHSLKLDEAWIGWYHSIMESWIKSSCHQIKFNDDRINDLNGFDQVGK